nr:hypothetical protein [uncultured Mucilaginibacter sp.]
MPIFDAMESFEINLSPLQITQLSKPDANVAAFLDYLFEPSSINYNQLALELQREFRQGGSPDVTRMAFDRVNYSAATGKGSFRIVLDVRFTFGCEDSVTEKKDQTSEWSFALNHDTLTINFSSSPFAESRSTADEF